MIVTNKMINGGVVQLVVVVVTIVQTMVDCGDAIVMVVFCGSVGVGCHHCRCCSSVDDGVSRDISKTVVTNNDNGDNKLFG